MSHCKANYRWCHCLSPASLRLNVAFPLCKQTSATDLPCVGQKLCKFFVRCWWWNARRPNKTIHWVAATRWAWVPISRCLRGLAGWSKTARNRLITCEAVWVWRLYCWEEGQGTKPAWTLNTLSFEVVPQGCKICLAPKFHHLVAGTKEMLRVLLHTAWVNTADTTPTSLHQ